MQKVLLGIVIIALLFGVGCKSPDYQYVKANKKNADTVLPDMIEYIEADESLTDLDKEVRINSIREWHELIDTAFEEYTEEEIGGE